MKKFLIVTLLFATLNLPASAEQPVAEQYRQMFASGNFYVECQMFMAGIKGFLVGSNRRGSVKMIFAGRNGNRMYRATNAGSFSTSYSRDSFDSLSTTLARIYSKPKPRAINHESFKTKSWPDVMYKNGKYYRFSTSGVAMRGTMSLFSNGGKNVSALILPEEELNSPNLNPDDEWDFIREDLALPDELAIFCWNEPFRDNTTPEPRYNGSSKREFDGKEYDCDQYINDIKSLAGNVIAQEAYNALYDGGKLVRIQKYLLRDGKEFYIQELVIKNISTQVPTEAFAIGKKIKVYAADKGDMKDLLEQPELVETLGGN